MAEVSVGRVLVASLHQAIADILPTRLRFYENWLNTAGLRDGTIGLAPLYAVLSFLRQEEGDAYAHIMSRAGEYAAEWTVASMQPIRRGFIKGAPAFLRSRLLLKVGRQLVHETYRGSRAIARVRKGTARVDLRASVFCTVREPVVHPLCGFYAAAFTKLMALFSLGSRAEVVSCRGTGERGCVLTMALNAAGIADEPSPVVHDLEVA
jgi:bacteriochlorophyll 4-vinyl reductase